MRWNDDELRRVLGANPKDIDAVMEAARRFESVAKTDAEFDELEDKIEDLNGKLEEANTEAQSWREDYEAEQTRANELQAECDTLHERVTELESQGAGLL